MLSLIRKEKPKFSLTPQRREENGGGIEDGENPLL
jgi:hypothetical protein